MKCACGLSQSDQSDRAFADVVEQVASGMAGKRADLAVVFSSMHHARRLGQLAEQILDRGLSRHVLGCTGESIIGGDREIEQAPALSLWAIELPGARLEPFRLTWDDLGFASSPEGLEPAALAGKTVLFLADPLSFPVEEWLKGLNDTKPPPRVLGGMASAASEPGKNALLLDADAYSDGSVALALDGGVSVRTVVSQGCRPIGRPFLVTRVEGNLVRELGRRPALEVLREQFAALDPADQARVQDGLHLGRVINEYQESFKRGDFLVRNIIGADDEGGLAITDTVRVGQTVQFHVRDAETADQDLRALLEADLPAQKPAGALLFTCNGRGTRLFTKPDHDVGLLRALLGPIPVAGFFAMGEIGPIGGQNYLHGYTASIAIFGP